MGLYSSTSETEQQATYAPLSSRGETYDSLFTNVMLANLKEFGGYDVTESQKTKYQDEGKANSLQAQITELEAQLITEQAAITQGTVQVGQNGRVGLGGGKTPADNIQRQIDAKRDELAQIPQVTYTDYDLKKQEDPRVLQAIDRYGQDSSEVTDLRQQVKDEKVDSFAMSNDIQKTFLKNVQKFTNGDYSYTPEQAAQVERYIGPVKDVINASVDHLISMADTTGTDLKLQLDDLATQIDKTGFDTLDALKAAQVQYETSGVTLMDAVKTANTSSYNRAKFQFDLLSQQADQQAAQQGALLGLPPGSMSEKMLAQRTKTTALQMLEKEAAERETNAAFQVQGMTEEGKQKISLSRVALAADQGAKKEKLGESRFNLTNALGQQKLGLESGRADAMLNLEQQRQSELKNLALGGIPQMLNAGSGALAFLQNQNSTKQQSAGNLLSPIGGQLAVAQQQQAGEAKTVSRTSATPSFMDSFTDILGTLAETGSTIMQGMSMGG